MVLDHRPHLHQPMAVAKHSQYLETVRTRAMYPRKISLDQQIQDQLGISTIVLLTSIGHSSDIRRVPQQYGMSKFLEHAFKPTAVAAGFQSYYYFSRQSGVKGSQVILLVMQFAK